MKTKFFLVALMFVFLPISLNFLSLNQARAASDTSVVIQPSKIEVTASPDQKLSRSFSIINRSNFYVKLKLIVKDFKQASETGQIQFYDATVNQAATWLVPQYLEIGLKPLETKDIGIVVNVPKNFSGGGHYGAILFQSTDSSGNVTTNNFGELILLTVTGSDIKTSAVIQSVNFGTGFMQKGNPVDFSFKMKNTGNTHFDANAKLVVQNWLGKEIGNYNIGQLTVYPKTSRLFQWRWNGTPSFGMYKAEVLLSNSSGTNNTFKPVDGMWFILFPWPIFLVLLVLAGMAFAIIKYRDKIFNTKILNRKRIKILSQNMGEIISIPFKRISK